MIMKTVLFMKKIKLSVLNRKYRKNAATMIKLVHKSFIMVEEEGCPERVCIMITTLAAESGGLDVAGLQS